MANSPPLWLNVQEASNLKTSIDLARKSGFTGILTPIVNQFYKREFIKQELAENHEKFARSPLILEAEFWDLVTPIVIPRNLSVNDKEIAKNNVDQFIQDLQFAYHIRTQYGNVIVRLGNNDPEKLGKLVKNYLNPHYGLFVEIPMVDPKVMSAVHRSDVGEDFVGKDQWLIWHKFHEATGFHQAVKLALVLSPDLPPEEEIRRWLGETVGMLIIPHNCFKLNASNFTSMTTMHSNTVLKFMQYTKCQIAIIPKGQAPRLQQDNCINYSSKRYSEYITHVFHRLEQNMNSGFEDHLRYPLQPLYDDLDSSTYETFEHDPAKYVLYQKAIENALKDRVSDEEVDTRTSVILIVGAGRGPFIRASVNASKNTGRKVRILVVEKNPNAIVTIRHLIEEIWPKEDIKLIKKDMRQVELRENADILVSELLGSIGDNELSPECLDGAQRLLKPDGISIPSDSKAYLRPAMSKLFYLNVKREREGSSIYKNPQEINWLLYPLNIYYIDDTQDLWTFMHPNVDPVIDNSRFKSLTFTAKIDCVCHGLFGYFSAKLYKDIDISIHPKSHTQGMGSWYPMALPVKNPMFLKKGESFKVNVWRKVEPNVKVWYEWSVEQPDGTVSECMNHDGWSHPIFLQREMEKLSLEE